MEKNYDLVGKDDIFVTSGTKELARKRKLFTRSVHIFLIDRHERIMVSKRPMTKKSYPGQMTSSAGGHVEKGEDYKEAARRELTEELGLKIPLRDIGRFDVISKKERAIHHLFMARTSKLRFKVNSSEIIRYEFLKQSLIKKDMALHPRRYAYPFHMALACYLSYIRAGKNRI